jgi:hypothetical protein
MMVRESGTEIKSHFITNDGQREWYRDKESTLQMMVRESSTEIKSHYITNDGQREGYRDFETLVRNKTWSLYMSHTHTHTMGSMICSCRE